MATQGPSNSPSAEAAETEALCQVDDFLSSDESDYTPFNVKPPRFVILSGPPGVGKTYAVRQAAKQHALPLYAVAPGSESANQLLALSKRLRDRSDGQRKRKNGASTNAQKHVILLDEIDEICPDSTSAPSAAAAQVVCELLDDLDGEFHTICIVGTTNRVSCVDTRLLRADRLDRHVCVGTPDATERHRILKALCTDVPSLSADIVHAMAHTFTHGYVASDLASLVRTLSAEVEDMHAPDTGHVRKVLERVSGQVTPSVLRSSGALTWAAPSEAGEVVVDDEVRQQLRAAVEWPFTHAEQFERLGLARRAGRGVLLHGPPGCGKTSVVRTLAAAVRLPFVRLTCADVFCSVVGESERVVREVFATARAAAPCILFLDEVDALAPRRGLSGAGGGGDAVNHKVLVTLLTEMDGIQSNSHGVFVVAATNRLAALDDAILRNGRFDDIIEIGLPSADERARIVRLVVNEDDVTLAEDVALAELVDATDGWSGADIKRMCTDAVSSALWAPDSLCGDSKRVTVHRRHFEGV